MIPFLENEKNWGIPYLEIDKFGGFTKFIFHVLSRYEIHIQAFANVFYGTIIISNPHLRKNIFEIYTHTYIYIYIYKLYIYIYVYI